MSIKTLFKLWDEFWFSETSPLAVAVFRILMGFIMILFVLLLTQDMLVWFGQYGLISNQTERNFAQVVGLNLLNLARDNDTFLLAFFVVFFAASLCMTIGYKTRVSVLVVFLCLNSLYHRNAFLFNSGDTYMRVMSFWLFFAASGNALSIDHLLNLKRNRAPESREEAEKFNYKSVSIWPMRLLQLQLALVYFHTFVAKFWGDTWVNGTSVYYSSRIEDLVRVKLPYVFDNLWTCQLLTWGTLVIELALFTLIWIKEFRYYVIALAIVFHLTIDLHMNIPLFEWIMMFSYVLFIDNQDLQKGLLRIRQKFPALFPTLRD
ncbi:MAG: HTTM domain-containing protein [Candidatus Melainabacteria bacterium]|nr:HTTM domain-containing protein [Candidatus Melainabacteria bacterium]